MTAAMEVQQRWMHDSAVTMTPASIPLATPTLSPIASNGFTNNGNELNQAQTALMSVVVFFIMTVILLCFIAYMNCSSRRNTNALPGDSATATNAEQQLDLVRRMSPEDRKAYVTNFLKTQKFEDTGPFSHRRKIRDKDEDVEANLSIRSTGIPCPSCAICLDPFQKGEDVCSAQNKLCTHEFHLTCIFPWLLKSQECPCCRRDYLSVEQDAMEVYLRERATQNLSSTLHSI